MAQSGSSTQPRCRASPVHDAVFGVKLRTGGRVLLELHVRSIRVFAPALPGLVTAQFFWRHRHAVQVQLRTQRVHVLHFQTKVMDPLAAHFRRRTGFENLDELPRARLQIKSEQLAVLEEIKMPLQAERAAIEIQAPVQII